MSKKAQQQYAITEDRLLKLVGQGTHPGADAVWDRVQEIKKLGHTAAVYYNEFSGFTVLDENDPEQMKRSTAISQRAKSFPR